MEPMVLKEATASQQIAIDKANKIREEVGLELIGTRPKRDR